VFDFGVDCLPNGLLRLPCDGAGEGAAELLVAAMGKIIIHDHDKVRLGDGVNADDVLWRYLDAAKFLDFIHHQIMFFSRGDQLIDKFEGMLQVSEKDSIKRVYEVEKIVSTSEEFNDSVREGVFVNCWHQSADDSMAMWTIYGRSSCSVALTNKSLV
jgi:hypothetical protein